MAQVVVNLGVAQAQGFQQNCRRELAGFVDAHPHQAVFVGLELQPGTAVGDEAGAVGATPVFVQLRFVIDAGAAHNLVDDHPLGAVDDEGAPIRHQGQFADENVHVFDLAGLFVDQASGHPDLRLIGGIPPLGLLRVVAGAVDLVPFGGIPRAIFGQEMQFQLAGVIDDGGKAEKLLFKPFSQKPQETLPLNLYQVRKGRSDRGLHC